MCSQAQNRLQVVRNTKIDIYNNNVSIFLVYAIFLNKFSRMVLSRIIVLVYFASLFLLAVTLFERVTDPNSKSNKYDKISVEFYDKIKKF